jgi:hypothetical protein
MTPGIAIDQRCFGVVLSGSGEPAQRFYGRFSTAERDFAAK